MIVQMSREFGRSFNICIVKLLWTFVLIVSTTGDSPDTVTVSCCAAIDSLTSTVALNPSVTMISLRSRVAKPLISNFSAYVPGGTDGKRYCPSVLVVVVCAAISAGLVAVTRAPGTAPPLESVTVPLILPVNWAAAGEAHANSTTSISASRLIAPPSDTPQGPAGRRTGNWYPGGVAHRNPLKHKKQQPVTV